jgi:hypothetical protein
MIVAYGLGFSGFSFGLVYDQSNMLPIYFIISAFLINLLSAIYLTFSYSGE